MRKARLKIADLPVPGELAELLHSQGYYELYPPQAEAVKAGVFEGKSLLLTTPTASGKTLVAILAAGKTVLEKGGKAVYLTPLRALANEKYEEFKTLETLTKPNGSRIRAMIATGDYDSNGEALGKGDIIVLTNEKFDALLRHGIPWIDEAKLFVADEAHLVGDNYRGPTIETILTKIIAMAPEAQILTLSATISNSKELAAWLGSSLVDTDWRPVKLVEGVYAYGEIFFSDKTKRKIDTNTNRGIPVDLAVDTVRDGGQSLIFAETRRRSVALAEKAAEVTPKYLSKDEQEAVAKIAKEILSTGEETETSRRLAGAVGRGAAFHHAGLDLQHRRLVEDGFRSGFIKILTSTPTLAAGVNLPARRVVLSSLYRYDSDYGGQAPISVLDYKQMCGRAGRPKFDTFGETVILARSDDEADDLYFRYVKGKPEPIQSQLTRGGALRTHVLATIATLPGISETELHNLFMKTLFANQCRKATVKTKINEAVEFLTDEMLVEKRGKRFLATEFGKRISILYIDPATGIIFRQAVQYSENKASPIGLLHLITAVPDFTPKFPIRKSDWLEAETFFDQHRNEFIIPVSNTGLDAYDEYMQGFRTLMTMWSWIHEASEETILEKHGVEPGDLHRSVENADWLLYSLGEVCKILGRAEPLREIDALRRRVKYGVKQDLLQLTTLEGIGRVRARSLYSAGYTDLNRLRKVSAERLAEVAKIGPTVARKIKEQLNE
ncbi:MAG: DEAD/DEAH box helicase [Thaumarchaeota archaeon]|nr:DEAD/DEAH box helicase [Nitrososphaerota archaeon]